MAVASVAKYEIIEENFKGPSCGVRKNKNEKSIS